MIMIDDDDTGDDSGDDGCMQKTYRLQRKSQHKVIASSSSPFSSTH